MPLGHLTISEFCVQDPKVDRQVGHCRSPGAGGAGEQREGWGHTALLLAVATLLEPQGVSLGPHLSLPLVPPSPPGSHTWMREGVQQDAAAGSRVALVGRAEPGKGGDEHSGGPRVYGDSLGILCPGLAAAFAPHQE